MEVDSRKLYAGQGYASLFTYCVQALHLSEHAAYLRIEAARLTRRFPAILEKLRDGSLHLTAVSLLGPHLTPENYVALLDEARHKSKREVEQLIARLRPLPDVPAAIRKLPSSKSTAIPSSEVPRAAPPDAGFTLPVVVAETTPLAILCCATQFRTATSRQSWIARSPFCWPIFRERSMPPRNTRAVLQRRDLARVTFLQESSEWCGLVTAGGVRFRGKPDVVPKPDFWNSTTSCRTQTEVKHPRRISSCDAVRITNTRRCYGPARRNCRSHGNHARLFNARATRSGPSARIDSSRWRRALNRANFESAPNQSFE